MLILIEIYKNRCRNKLVVNINNNRERSDYANLVMIRENSASERASKRGNAPSLEPHPIYRDVHKLL